MSAPVQVDQQIEIQIDRLSYDGGRGVGRYQGFVVFVPYTAPDETVLVQIKTVQKSFATAELIEVIKKSPYRRKPQCPVFGECGGCAWQHVQYETQLQQKQAFVLRSLEKFLQKDGLDNVIQDFHVVPSENEFRYRNRIQIRTFGTQTGFVKSGTNQIVPIQDCLIAETQLVNAFQKLPRKPNAQLKVEMQLEQNQKVSIRRLDEEDSVFTQVNTSQNKKMQDLVANRVAQFKPSEVYDLFCGDGNLTFPMAQVLPSAMFIAVEFSEDAIARARKMNKEVSRIHFFSDDSFRHLKKQKSIPKDSVIVVDPPRAGLSGKICDEIIRLNPSGLVYVSCNLSTLARDLAVLHREFRILSLDALDMFPQTEWVETIVTMAPRTI